MDFFQKVYVLLKHVTPTRPLYLNSQLLSLLFDAQASELSSRMSAMKAATDNAKEWLGTAGGLGRKWEKQMKGNKKNTLENPALQKNDRHNFVTHTLVLSL